jgi:hypothetical protein
MNGFSRIRYDDGSEGRIYNFAGAIADRDNGILIVTNVGEEFGSPAPPILSIFHQLDIDLFFESIINNIRHRIDAYKK